MGEFAGNDELLALVEATTLDLPGSRKSIADFLVQEGSGVENLSMAEVAELTFTSKPSLVRFSKAMGFSGWRDFRLEFVKAMRRRESQRHETSEVDPNYPFSADDDLPSVVTNVCSLERQAILEMASQLDEETLCEAARRVTAARCLVFFGAAPNSYFGELLAYKLSQLGTTCHVPTEDEWSMVARGMGPEDCAIVVSYSGEGPQRKPVSLVSKFNEDQVLVVAITNSGRNWLREHCDCVLSFRPCEHIFSKISGYYSEQCVRFALDALYSACFSLDYDRNEMARLRMIIEYERTLQHRVVDVLPY